MFLFYFILDTTLSNSGQVVFTFDISSIAKMEHVELMGAEFRIRSQLSNSSTTRTHDRLDQFKLNMFEILKDANTQRQKAVLHTSQQLTTAPDADNVFTVTSIVRDWLSGKSPSYSLSVELDSETGEDHSVFLEDTPILVLYMNKEREWKDRDGLLKHEEKKRLRRQTQFSPPEATGPHNSILPCSLKSVSIHIKDLRLSTSIIAPTKIRINYCSGHCIYPFTSTPASNSAHLQGRVAALSTHEPSIPMPCCAPKDFHPNIYLLKDEEDGTLSARVQQNEKVASCECR
uniref:Transforming growth factor beta E HduTGFbE n=1 Tax=Halisarca dujardinii TaxID=2583056 RepID=A0A8F8ATY6_HALDU|nr:transforming growth factor beta E HduTGFbE [Halisarca dujardinii]